MESIQSKGPGRSIVSLLDEQLLLKQAEDANKQGMYPLRPSSASSCGRKLAHDLMAWEGHTPKAPDPRKPNIIRLLNLGHSIEYHALKLLETIPGYRITMKQQIVSLFTLPSGRIVEGSIDAVIWSEDDRGVMDVKSVGARNATAFSDTWDQDHGMLSRNEFVERIDEYGYWVEDAYEFVKTMGEHALVSNIKQINAYAHSQFLKDRKITWGSVVRYDKAKSRMMEIRFNPSERLYEELKAKYIAIENAVAAKNPLAVKQDYVLGSFACAFCPHQSKCWPQASKKQIYASYKGKDWAVKVAELEGHELVSQLFAKYQSALIQGEEIERLEKEILVELAAHEVSKVKLDDGTVWDVVSLKSPKPHLELRPGKE